MDIDAAIHGHQDWKIRLRSYAQGSTVDHTSAELAGTDDHCALGKWLHGEGKDALEGSDLHAKLLAEHARFHAGAADIVRLFNAGQKDKALAELDDPFAEFSRASTRVIALLMVLKQRL